MSDVGLATRTLRGALWSGLGFVLSRGIAVVSTVVLARLLAPADFGIYGIALLALAWTDAALVAWVTDTSIALADRPNAQGTAASLALVGALVATIGMILLAPLLGRWAHDARVTEAVRIMAIVHIPSAITLAREAELLRDLRLRARFALELVRGVAKAALTIMLAMGGVGTQSLSIGHACGLTVTMIVLLAVYGRARYAWDRRALVEVRRFGLPLAVTGALSLLAVNVDYAVIAARLGVVTLGLYFLAYRLPELLIVQVSNALQVPMLPTLARLRGEPQRRVYLSALRAGSAAAGFLGGLLVVIAPEVGEVALGEQWRAAVMPMRVIAGTFAVAGLSFGTGAMFKAMGRPWVSTALVISRLIVAVPALWWAAGHGATAVAVTNLVIMMALVVAQDVVLVALGGPSWRRLGVAIRPSLLATLTAIGAAAVVGWLVDGPLALAVVPPIAVLVFLATFRLVAPGWLSTVWRSVRDNGAEATEAKP